MSNAEIKIDLISHIASIKDEVRLKDLMQLIKFQTGESIFVTNEDEKRAISEARNQIANGEISSNDEVQNEIKEWLNR